MKSGSEEAACPKRHRFCPGTQIIAQGRNEREKSAPRLLSPLPYPARNSSNPLTPSQSAGHMHAQPETPGRKKHDRASCASLLFVFLQQVSYFSNFRNKCLNVLVGKFWQAQARGGGRVREYVREARPG